MTPKKLSAIKKKYELSEWDFGDLGVYEKALRPLLEDAAALAIHETVGKTSIDLYERMVCVFDGMSLEDVASKSISSLVKERCRLLREENETEQMGILKEELEKSLSIVDKALAAPPTDRSVPQWAVEELAAYRSTFEEPSPTLIASESASPEQPT